MPHPHYITIVAARPTMPTHEPSAHDRRRKQPTPHTINAEGKLRREEITPKAGRVARGQRRGQGTLHASPRRRRRGLKPKFSTPKALRPRAETTNAEGVAAQSPGLGRASGPTLGPRRPCNTNPVGGCGAFFAPLNSRSRSRIAAPDDATTLSGLPPPHRCIPRVARYRGQPWAGSHSPVGAGDAARTRANIPHRQIQHPPDGKPAGSTIAYPVDRLVAARAVAPPGI